MASQRHQSAEGDGLVIVVLADAPREAELARRLFDGARHRLGDLDLDVRLAAIDGQSLALVASILHDAPMSHDQAAQTLGCSTRTVRRLVATGELERCGRRITAGSIRTVLENRQ